MWANTSEHTSCWPLTSHCLRPLHHPLPPGASGSPSQASSGDHRRSLRCPSARSAWDGDTLGYHRHICSLLWIIKIKHHDLNITSILSFTVCILRDVVLGLAGTDQVWSTGCWRRRSWLNWSPETSGVQKLQQLQTQNQTHTDDWVCDKTSRNKTRTAMSQLTITDPVSRESV